MGFCVVDNRIMVEYDQDSEEYKNYQSDIYISYWYKSDRGYPELEFYISNGYGDCNYSMYFTKNKITTILDAECFDKEYTLEELNNVVDAVDYIKTASLSDGDYLSEPHNTTLMNIVAELEKYMSIRYDAFMEFNPVASHILIKRAH